MVTKHYIGIAIAIALVVGGYFMYKKHKAKKDAEKAAADAAAATPAKK